MKKSLRWFLPAFAVVILAAGLAVGLTSVASAEPPSEPSSLQVSAIGAKEAADCRQWAGPARSPEDCPGQYYCVQNTYFSQDGCGGEHDCYGYCREANWSESCWYWDGYYWDRVCVPVPMPESTPGSTPTPEPEPQPTEKTVTVTGTAWPASWLQLYSLDLKDPFWQTFQAGADGHWGVYHARMDDYGFRVCTTDRYVCSDPITPAREYWWDINLR